MPEALSAPAPVHRTMVAKAVASVKFVGIITTDFETKAGRERGSHKS